MQYLLSQSEYDGLMSRSRGIDEIDRIINERPETDSHGNSVSYSYRFDKTISRIMDVLDTLKAQEVENNTWQIPWVLEGGKNG